MAGFLAGIALLCIKRLRFLAWFAFLMPVSGSYAAIVGFWGAAVGLESLGVSERVSGIGGVVCLFIGGLLGAWGAYKIARGRMKRL